ncbi:unnamed protein product [Rhizoctonia solani]|uniref:DH domain-containing protein n=1 Tax=Rhizoctonia solani TaxID=456999 RepID=A0A8H3GES0_9AGAM|nr:unnamed protein product [Rhizoctonia solani]
MVEISDSEDKFVGLLERLVHVYLPKVPVSNLSSASILARNAAMLLELHTRLAKELRANKASRLGLCQVLISYASELTSLHQEFSAGHTSAKATLNREQVANPQLWALWEKERADQAGAETDGSRSRSFEDLLIAPIQRVCRYHLLVASLRDGTEEAQVGDAVAAMQAVAAKVNEIVRVRADEDRTKVVLDRMDPVPGLATGYLASLGPCLLIGTLDVVYYEATKPPLVTVNSQSSQLTSSTTSTTTPSTPTNVHPLLASGKPQKAKHLAAFLWTGYLVLCKVHTKRARYEPKRWFPLKIVPHSLGLSHLNPSSTNLIDSGVSDCSSSDASPLFPETHLPSVQSSQQLAPPVIQQLQPKKSFGHMRTKSQSQSQSQAPTQEDPPAPLRLGHVQVQPSDQVFPYGIRITFSRHVFELGASCEEERDIWVRAIADARVGNELVLVDKEKTITRSQSTGTITAEDKDKDHRALVRGRSEGGRPRDKSVERSVRERSKSRERGALSVREKSREPSLADQRSREQSRERDRDTVRDDRTRDDRTIRDHDKPLPHPPTEKPPLQRKKSGVLGPQDGPVQIGNWIVQRLETVTTPSGTTVSAPQPISHVRNGSEYARSEVSYGRSSEHSRSEHSRSEVSHTRNGSEHTRNASEYSAPYSNPYASPPPSLHTSPPSSFPADRLLPHMTGSSSSESVPSSRIADRLEDVFLRPRYGHGYGYAAASQPQPNYPPTHSSGPPRYGHGYGYAAASQPQPGYPPTHSSHSSGPYVGPSGQYVGPSGYGPSGYAGSYSLTRESSQSSNTTSTYTSSTSTATPTNYAPYARSDAPYARSEVSLTYRADGVNYPRSETSYARSDYAPSASNYAPSASGYAPSATASNYAPSATASNYAPSTVPTTTYSSNSSTPHGSQVSTPAGYGPTGYTSRFQTRSRANESSIAANLERAFGVAPTATERTTPAAALGADVYRTNSSSTGGSRSFPPSPVATALPALPAPVPVQPVQQLAPQQVVRRPSNNTRDPVVMALADVISSACREARDRASLKRKPLWMTPEEAAAAAEKEKEKAANGMMGMVRPRRMSSALVGGKSKTVEKDKDKEKEREKDKDKDKGGEKEKKKTAAPTVVRPSSSEGVVVSGESAKMSLQRKRATIHGAMHAFPSMGPPSPERETQSLSAHGHGTPSSQPTQAVSQPQPQPPQPPPKPPSMHMRGASTESPISPPRSRTVSSSGSFVDGMRDFLLRRAFAKSAENMALPAPANDPPNPVYKVGEGLTNTKSEEGLPRTTTTAKAKSGSVPVPGQELYEVGKGITNTETPPPKRKPRISLRSSSAGSAFFAQLTGKRKSSKNNNSTPMSSLTFTPMTAKDKAEYEAAMRARESRSRSNEYYRRISPNQGGPPNRNMLGAELYSSPSSMRLQPSPVAEESRFLEEGDDGVYTGYR